MVPVMRSWLGLTGWVLASLAAGAVGARATRHAREFYAGLVKPAWAPPGWLFGPVWTVLYLMMGIAAWLVWRQVGWTGAAVGLSLFLGQLLCNALWRWLFFTWRRGALASADIVLLAGLIVATALAFARVRTLAAGLLLPYLAWVMFATALTLALWRANPAQLSK